MSSTLAVSRTNLLPNPSLESGISGWGYWDGSGGSGTASLAWVTSGGYSGSSFLRTTITTLINPLVIWTGINPVCTPGLPYTLSVYLRSSADVTVRGVAYFVGSSRSVVGEDYVCPANVWTRVWVTGTAAAGDNALQAYLVVLSGGLPVGTTVDTDAIMLESSLTLGEYFDGATPDTTTSHYGWTGAAHASTSTQSLILQDANRAPAWRTGSRTERFEYRLLSLNLQPVSTLEGVESCSLSGSVFSDVRWGGKLSWSGTNVPDLTGYLVHPWYIVSGDNGVEESYPLCPPCYARSASVSQSDLVPATTDMDLYDVSYRLAKRLKLTGELGIAPGGVITDTVVSRLAATGARYSATPSARTLTAALNWAIGTSEMKVLNDLLSAAGYWSVAADLAGAIVVAPWVDPRQRAASYTFADGDVAITGSVTRNKDDFDVPNRMTGVQRVQEGQTPLTVTVTLDTVSPNSPYTYAARGYWVDGEPLLDQDAADLTTLTGAVTRSLLSAANPGETLALTHAWVPEVVLGVVVAFRGALYTVQKMNINCDLGLPVQAEWSKVV